MPSFDYGIWPLVVLHAGIVLFFAFSFYHPATKRDWRSFGVFAAFIVALFTEMYGFPLTIYLLSGWLSELYPQLDLFSHGNGHLWQTIFGWEGDPHTDPLHLASNLVILGGFILLAASWRVLYRAQREGRVARTGSYARLRHPQYLAFIVIMIGFFLQWPTLPTLIMLPVLLLVYRRLALREEKEALERFGDEYAGYAAITPRFLPRIGRRTAEGPQHQT